MIKSILLTFFLIVPVFAQDVPIPSQPQTRITILEVGAGYCLFCVDGHKVFVLTYMNSITAVAIPGNCNCEDI